MTHVSMPMPFHGQIQQTRDLDSRLSRTASTATKELDDLMASLSDFKVNVTAPPTPSQARLSGDYAKPNKAKPASPGKYKLTRNFWGTCLMYLTSMHHVIVCVCPPFMSPMENFFLGL